MKLKFDLSQEGLLTMFRPYQVYCLAFIHEQGHGTSGEVYKYVLKTDDPKSRASIIFFLNDMVEEGILEFHEKSGKGGYHRVYTPIYSTMKTQELHLYRMVIAHAERQIQACIGPTEGAEEEASTVVSKSAEAKEPL